MAQIGARCAYSECWQRQLVVISRHMLLRDALEFGRTVKHHAFSKRSNLRSLSAEDHLASLLCISLIIKGLHLVNVS